MFFYAVVGGSTDNDDDFFIESLYMHRLQYLGVKHDEGKKYCTLTVTSRITKRKESVFTSSLKFPFGNLLRFGYSSVGLAQS